ncbi:deoxyribodipyrimidine photolyase [Bradyrhizobiaceae bacterium SG-6C]|nr:deoxyribodipyrimidine photolyase [Bradyrhizobiaceae bacterium SG-6C]
MTSSSAPPVIVWFRDDLRLSDHPALHAAAETDAPLVLLYVLDEQSTSLRPPRGRPLGGASRWWLAQSLRSLQASLAARGQTLVLRKGAAARVISDLAQDIEAASVHWIESDVPSQSAMERDVTVALKEIGVQARGFRGDLLVKPASLRNKEGRGLRVFTPFWKRILSLGDPPQPLPAPKKLKPGPAVASDDLASWNLEPKHPDWAGGLRDTWTPGESAAQTRLHDFLETGIKGYATLRDRPDRDGTSRLSPHLRFGEISPRQVWHAANFAAAQKPAIASDVGKFLSELGWREFSRHLLFDLPDLAEKNLQSSFDAFPWRRDAKALRAWQRGRTGYPIVDAGMRELWHTGVMHNRVRMVVASFLVKHLLIDWRHGEKWFWDTLVDADPGSNPASWQWVAGSGADAAPYFRVFNPVLQGEKFDPDGAYVSRWVPELARLSAKLIHQPWEATPMELAAAGVTLGKTYPEPMVDHKAARARALAAYAKTREP